MSVFKRPDSTGWHYEFVVRGVRLRGKAPYDDKRQADAWLKAEKARVKAAAADKVAAPSMTFDAAADRYWTEVGQHSKERDLAANLERLVLWVGQRTPISDINNDLVARLVARRRADIKTNAAAGIVKDEEGRPVLVSPSTVNRSVTALLRRIMTRARKAWEIPLREPDWSQHMLKEPEERVRELDFAEEERLFESLRPDYRPITAFVLVVGLRRETAVTLTWNQIKWAEGQLRVKGKGDKWQTLPITPAITEILWPLWQNRDPSIEQVFTYTAERTRTCATSKKQFVRGKRYAITYSGWGNELARACKAAGVVDFKLHDTRHTAATRTLRGSKNLAAVQKLLNHSDVKTTMKYAHVLVDDVAEALSTSALDVAARRARYEEAAAKIPHGTPHGTKRMRTNGRKKKRIRP
ncbi:MULTISPECIES: tyrosine-type recombinase/integrase [Methylopilaceae]|nr:site-specific integrase [Hansschlegelia zhihuaiae]